MSQLLRFNKIHFISIISTLAILASCNKDISIPLDRVNEDIAVTMIDTFTVNTSNYQLDYLTSASLGTVLVGKTDNPEIGSVKSSSYFKVLLDSYTNNIPQEAEFDSINLVVKPALNKYYYGDTTQNQTLSVHRVTENIVTTDITKAIDNYKTPVYVTGENIFTNQKFDYQNTPLGTLTFKPRIHAGDTISIKLDDNFGKQIYDMIISNNYNVKNVEAFQSFLKGLVIVPDENNTAILGLNDTIQVNINYSYVGSDGFKTTGKKSIVSSSKTTLQYNNIEYDRTGTSLASLTEENREISFKDSDNKLFIQSGTGLATKIKLPSLKEFMYTENISINKAELIIETESPRTGPTPIPETLMLMVTNKNGIPTNYVPVPFSTTIQQSVFTPGNDVGENNKYVFNLIDYVKNYNSTRYIDTDLLLSTVSPSLFNTVNTAKIATYNGKPLIKLNIVYTKFK